MTDRAETSLTGILKEYLYSEGFSVAGIAPALPHPEDAERIGMWVAEGMNGSLGYMARNNDKRADITKLVPGARSVIVAAVNIYNEDIPENNDGYFIARYARGGDYHVIIKEKLFKALELIKRECPGASGRVFVDSAPLSEKSWAIRAGLGWRGRHSIIINREIGSFFMLGEIVTSAVLDYDSPVTADYCGSCKLCTEACPTGAINDNRTINVTKCISYFSIENPPEEAHYPGNSVYGCDRCQEVCPWNKKAVITNVNGFHASRELMSLNYSDWESMTEQQFERLFPSSPIRRTGYEAIMRNVRNAAKNRLSE